MSMVLSKSPATITQLLPAMRSLGQSGNRLMSRRQASIDCGHGPDTCMARTVGSGETPGTGNRPPIVGIVKPSTGLLVWSGYRPTTGNDAENPPSSHQEHDQRYRCLEHEIRRKGQHDVGCDRQEPRLLRRSRPW